MFRSFGFFILFIGYESKQRIILTLGGRAVPFFGKSISSLCNTCKRQKKLWDFSGRITKGIWMRIGEFQHCEV